MSFVPDNFYKVVTKYVMGILDMQEVANLIGPKLAYSYLFEEAVQEVREEYTSYLKKKEFYESCLQRYTTIDLIPEEAWENILENEGIRAFSDEELEQYYNSWEIRRKELLKKLAREAYKKDIPIHIVSKFTLEYIHTEEECRAFWKAYFNLY